MKRRAKTALTRPYVPRRFTCEDCAAASVFTPSEQRHWFEALSFSEPLEKPRGVRDRARAAAAAERGNAASVTPRHNAAPS